jgi:phosphate ABC transporter phosphate-binding protein
MRPRLFAFPAFLIFAAALIFGGAGCGKGAKRLNGGGSTFVDPMMQKWSSAYNDAKGIQVDYSKSGSGDGIKNMTNMTLDFGCTDVPMNAEQTEAAKAKDGDVVHVPVAIGSVAVVYNIPGLDGQLVLDGKVLGQIYTGELNPMVWDHPDIAALNPNLKLPKVKIVPVYRAESSGTTNIFKEFLHAGGAAIKPSANATWPEKTGGSGEQGSDGIAGRVGSPDRGAGCVGYVELTYAKKNKIPYAAIRNPAGKDVLPNPDSATAAAAAALGRTQTNELYTRHPLTFSLINAAGPDAYPICGMSYAVFYKKQPKDKGAALVEFLKWATTEGQKFAGELDYAPFPKQLQDDIQKRLGEVELQ